MSGSLNLRSVSFSYQSRSGDPAPVFERFSLSFRLGFVLGVMGQSGVGKSTLLKLIKGLEHVDAGGISYDPQPCVSVMLPQETIMLPWRRIRGNITLGAELGGHDVDPDDFSEVTQFLEIDRLLDKSPSAVSGGQLRRVALARAVLTPSTLLLLDEPFAGLDPTTRDSVARGLRHFMRRHHTTCVFVAHEVRDALVLSDDLIVLSGSPATLAYSARRRPAPGGGTSEYGVSAWDDEVADAVAKAI